MIVCVCILVHDTTYFLINDYVHVCILHIHILIYHIYSVAYNLITTFLVFLSAVPVWVPYICCKDHNSDSFEPSKVVDLRSENTCSIILKVVYTLMLRLFGTRALSYSHTKTPSSPSSSSSAIQKYVKAKQMIKSQKLKTNNKIITNGKV